MQRQFPFWSPIGLWSLFAACAAPAPIPAPAPDQPQRSATTPVFSHRPTMAEASATFAAAGLQPGARLPQLALLDVDGAPADLQQLQAGRPLVLVTCSLTCNVARRQQARIRTLQQRWGESVAIVLVYTIDAHPRGSACPYTAEEWVPAANEQDGVLVAQPTTLAARLALAQRYARDWAGGVRVLVDPMHDTAWQTLGRAPNLGLCIDRGGVVVARTGWFDGDAIDVALQRLAN